MDRESARKGKEGGTAGKRGRSTDKGKERKQTGKDGDEEQQGESGEGGERQITRQSPLLISAINFTFRKQSFLCAILNLYHFAKKIHLQIERENERARRRGKGRGMEREKKRERDEQAFLDKRKEKDTQGQSPFRRFFKQRRATHRTGGYGHCRLT